MLDKIKEIIIEQLNLQGVEITEETSFKDDLGADSLDLFELVMAFEEEFGIEKERFRHEWISASEGEKFQRTMEEFHDTLTKLGPLEL